MPRLDKLSIVVPPAAAQAAVAEPSTGQPLYPAHVSSTSEAAHPDTGAAHLDTSELRRSSRNGRRSPPRSPQPRHHGKATGVLTLTPLSAILFGNASGAAKKPNSQSGRLKAVLRERAVSRGMRRPDAAPAWLPAHRLGLVRQPARRAGGPLRLLHQRGRQGCLRMGQTVPPSCLLSRPAQPWGAPIRCTRGCQW